MSTSLSFSLHFWSGREELLIRETDFGVFRFHDKTEYKDIQENQRRQYAQDKMSYSLLRGHQPSLDSKQRTGRSSAKQAQVLRGGLRELEILLAEQTVVFAKWRSSALYQFMLSAGTVVSVRMTKLGDIEKITFDKYLVGRVLDFITDVQFSSKLIVITYLESRVTVVHFGKLVNFACYEALERYDPKVTWLDLMGPPGRRLQRKALLSPGDLFCLIWWSSSDQEVFPWTPNLREEDRANVVLFSLKNPAEPRRLGFIRTQSDPLAFRFISYDQAPLPPSRTAPLCTLHFLGQETSRRGEIHVENTILLPVEGDGMLRRKHPQRVAVAAHVTCFDFASNLAILGCADGTILVLDCFHHKLVCQTKHSFIPNLIRVHPDGAIFIVATEKGVLQCFDIALTPIRLQFSHDDMASSNVLDLSQYFRPQMSLVEADFCARASSLANLDDACAMSAMATNYLVLRFHGGPLVMARISGGVYHSGALGTAQMTAEYLKHQQFHQVLLLLGMLEWSQHGSTIISCLNSTFNKLMRAPFCREKEVLMELCLGLFYSPSRPIHEEVQEEYSEPIHDLSRKFFHHLLRHNQLVKSFQLAVDINDYDLFMDLYHSASRLQLTDLAEASLIKARSVYHDASSGGDHHLAANATGGDDEVSSGDDSEESLPPPPPTPPKPQQTLFAAPRGPQPPTSSRENEYPPPDALPSPMQLFSSVVHVEHPPLPGVDVAAPALRGPLRPHISATYAQTTSAKRISTNEFKSPEEREAPGSIRYDSIVSLPRINVSAEEAEDIKVVHFGLV